MNLFFSKFWDHTYNKPVSVWSEADLVILMAYQLVYVIIVQQQTIFIIKTEKLLIKTPNENNGAPIQSIFKQ